MKDRIVILDLETTPWVSQNYGTKYDPKVVRVLKESYILCYAYKIYGEKKIHFERSRNGSDEKIVKKLWKILNDNDIVIAFNGIGFDTKVFNSRARHWGLGPPSPYRIIDPLKTERRVFKNISNTLDHVTKMRGFGGKNGRVGMDIWNRCMDSDRDKEAWDYAQSYNENDIVILEQEYNDTKAWTPNHPNMGAWDGGKVCKYCSSDDLQSRGLTPPTNAGLQYQRYCCNDCGGWSQSRFPVERTQPELK